MRLKISLLALTVLLAACSSSSSLASPVSELALTPTPSPEPSPTPTPAFSSNPLNDGMVARRNGDYGRAVTAFQLVLNSDPSTDLAQEAQFRLGEAYWLNNDDANAVSTLNAFLQAYPGGGHAPEAHYILANSYQSLKDYANALEQLRLYRGLTQTLAGDVDGSIADVLVLAGDSADALKQYEAALQDKTLSASTRVNVLMREADVYLGLTQPAQAAARYDAALAVAADAPTKANLDLRAGEAYAAANQLNLAIARWSDAITKYPEQPDAYKSLVDLVNRNAAVDDFQRGLVDLDYGSYDAAIAAFGRTLDGEATRAGDAHYYAARAYVGKGAYSQAIAEYNTIIQSLPKDARVPDAYLGKAAAYGAIGQVDNAVAVYDKFAAAYPNDANAPQALWLAAQLLDQSNRDADAAAAYESLQAKYPDYGRSDDALFWAGLDYYTSKDYKTAAARWQTLVKKYAQSSLYSRALFWLGKAALVQKQNDAAKTYWTQAAARTDYYGWRAKDALSPANPEATYDLSRYAMDGAADRAELEKWLAGWIAPASAAPLGQLDGATRNDLHFQRGAELLRLDRTVDARREFLAVLSTKQDDPRALYALALYFRDNNLYSFVIDCGERIAALAAKAKAPDAPRGLWMLRYPTFYADVVVPGAQANQIDPFLYFGLIRQESGFNPWSTSSVGARGLGQVMPGTGEDIARRLGVKTYTGDQLYLPFVSIRFGEWYLAQDLKGFDEPIYALAAYNAGSSRIKQWQRSDLDLAVEAINLSQTSTYVRVVYSNWRQYQAIYR